VLRNVGFHVAKPKGFSGKRESTWALREAGVTIPVDLASL
jgi:hypothetical protein